MQTATDRPSPLWHCRQMLSTREWPIQSKAFTATPQRTSRPPERIPVRLLHSVNSCMTVENGTPAHAPNIGSRERRALVIAGDDKPHRNRAWARIVPTTSGCFAANPFTAVIADRPMRLGASAGISIGPVLQAVHRPQACSMSWPKWDDSRAAWQLGAANNRNT